jgi:hypothetical protein
MGPSWSWSRSYSSSIYNYLCNLGVSLLKLSSIPVHGEVYSIQHYVIKFVTDMRQIGGFLEVMVFKATFNNISCISWRSVLLAEETGVPRENHRPAACHWQTLSHNVVSSTPRHEQGSNSTSVMIGPDCTGSCKSNYYTITTTTAPYTKYDILSCNHYICFTIKGRDRGFGV